MVGNLVYKLQNAINSRAPSTRPKAFHERDAKGTDRASRKKQNNDKLLEFNTRSTSFRFVLLLLSRPPLLHLLLFLIVTFTREKFMSDLLTFYKSSIFFSFPFFSCHLVFIYLFFFGFHQSLLFICYPYRKSQGRK